MNGSTDGRQGTGAPWGDEGIIVEAGANAPVRLDDPDSAWIVESGSVDVFVIKAAEDSTSNRHYLWTVDDGGFLLGMDVSRSSAGHQLLAVGIGGTRLRRLPVARLGELAADPEARPLILDLFEGFVTRLSRHCEELRRPRLQVTLEIADAVTVEAGNAVGAVDELVWVQHQSGSSTYQGQAGLVLDHNDVPLPMAKGIWLEVVEDATLSVLSTEAVIARGQGIDGIALLRALFLAWSAVYFEEEEEVEKERLARKAEAEERMLRSGVAELASVLTGEVVPSGVTSGADDLFDTCVLVGRAAGIEFALPPEWVARSRTRDPLGSICRASRVRSRRVGLRDRWWHTDSGPMLGFLAEESAAEEPATEGEAEEGVGSPVALIADGRGRYRCSSVEDPGGRLVDEAMAAKLQPFAHSFYRPFPDKAIDGWSLVQIILKDVRKELLMVLLMALFAGLLGLAVPLAIGLMFSSVIPSAQPDQVLLLLLGLVAVNLGAALFELTRAFALVRVEGKSNAMLQAGVIDRLLALPVPFFRDYSVGDLTMRAVGINTIRDLLSGAAANSIISGVFSVVNLGLLLWYDWRLALMAVLLLLGAILLTTAFALPAVRYETRRTAMQGGIAGLVFQMVGGIAKLRVAAAEGRALAVWASRFKEQKGYAYKTRSYQNVVTVFNDVLPLVATFALFATVGWLLTDTDAEFNTGTFVAFNAAFGTFFASGVALSNTMVNLLNIKPVFDRARPILETLPEVDATKPDPGALDGLIEGFHLSFRYVEDGPLILDDVTFRAEAGAFIAFVGPSGSGKSTTLRLLLGFEQPENGVIYYDGQDMRSVDITGLRSQIGVVLQSSRIMAGDLFTNIIGSSLLTLDDAWEAAEMAGFAEDIRDMPMGMHTIISEGGSTISGGQRQRLLIARALARKPRLIYFDEATSALDNRTQEQVSRSLERMRATRLVIAHRLSTIRNADHIYVMDKGRIVQSGAFEELAETPGLFAELIKRQIA